MPPRQPSAPGPPSPTGPASASAPAPAPSASAFFDLYIVGGDRLDAPALLNVADLIASRYRVTAPSVAQGLRGAWCLVGKRMVEPAAKQLADELGDLGARTEALPAGAPLPVSRLAPSKSDARRAPPQREPSLAGSMEGAGRWRYLDNLLNTPLKRAFAGLALALVIGFVPAAYYAFGISGVEVRRIRARQLELSEQPGTKAIVDEFERLEVAIGHVRGRGLAHTAILWVLVTGIAGAALSRVAGRGDRATSPA